jgi:hypothetical protein
VPMIAKRLIGIARGKRSVMQVLALVILALHGHVSLHSATCEETVRARAKGLAGGCRLLHVPSRYPADGDQDSEVLLQALSVASILEPMSRATVPDRSSWPELRL